MLKKAITLLFLILLPAPSSAAEAVDAALVAHLMAWVEHETGTSVAQAPVVIVNHEAFQQVVYRQGETFAGRPQAAYRAGTVYLDNLRWDPEEPTQLSLLVHELVHHAQRYMKDVTWACPDAREAQAYILQNRWLEQQGHAPFVRTSWIKRMSACPGGTERVALAQFPE